MPSRRRLRARLLQEQQGLSIVEVLVAAMLMVLGALAIFQLIDAATRTSYRAEQSQVVSNLLQREMEELKSSAASSQDLAMDPGSLTSCPSPLPEGVEERWDSGSAEFDGRPMVFQTEGSGVPACEQVEVAPDAAGEDRSDVGLTLYRFIAWFDPDIDDCAPPGPDTEDDPDTCGMRRVTVGAQPDPSSSGGERAYQEMQSDVLNLAVSE